MSRESLIIRFTEFEASVEGVLGKVVGALGVEDVYVLTDGQGHRIVDSEGTRGRLLYFFFEHHSCQ